MFSFIDYKGYLHHLDGKDKKNFFVKDGNIVEDPNKVMIGAQPGRALVDVWAEIGSPDVFYLYLVGQYPTGRLGRLKVLHHHGGVQP